MLGGTAFIGAMLRGVSPSIYFPPRLSVFSVVCISGGGGGYHTFSLKLPVCLYPLEYMMRPRQFTKQPGIRGWLNVYILALLIALIEAAPTSISSAYAGNADSVFAKSSHNAPTATLSSGLKVHGKTRKEASSSSSLDEFLGVPFAQPPVGDLRFRAPKPYKAKSSTVINATKIAKLCVHTCFSSFILSSLAEGFLVLIIILSVVPNPQLRHGQRTVCI